MNNTRIKAEVTSRMLESVRNGKVGQALARASRIYYGRDRECRCGCRGNYAEKGSPAFARYSNALLKALALGDFRCPIEFGRDAVNVPVGDESRDMCYCLVLE